MSTRGLSPEWRAGHDHTMEEQTMSKDKDKELISAPRLRVGGYRT